MDGSNGRADERVRDSAVVHVMLALAKGNPGACTVLANLSHEYFGVVAAHGITGSRLWVLFKDLCDQDMQVLQATLARIRDDPLLRRMAANGQQLGPCFERHDPQ
jgi:hypothetical protein